MIKRLQKLSPYQIAGIKDVFSFRIKGIKIEILEKGAKMAK